MLPERHAEGAGSKDLAAPISTGTVKNGAGGGAASPKAAAGEADPQAVLREVEDAGVPSSDALPARLGTLVGGYRLEELLGVGGTAAVYRGVNEAGGAVAIKVLHAWLGADVRAKKRFLREAVVASKLVHPAVVPMLAEGEDESGNAYLVMELCEGETLETRRTSAKEGRLPLAEVERLAGELLSVLAVAHAGGVVHRDIKPGNLLLTREGRLRVLDFGIARATELAGGPSLVTRTGAVLGTALFMPPEQALGVQGDIDARTDVWAVGATMFTLLTGQFVHKARSVNEALVLAATQPAPPIRRVLCDVPAALAQVIDRALSFERNERYRDASEMQAALERALHGQPGERHLVEADTLPDTDEGPRAPVVKKAEVSRPAQLTEVDAAGGPAVTATLGEPAAESVPRPKGTSAWRLVVGAAAAFALVAYLAGWLDTVRPSSHAGSLAETGAPSGPRSPATVDSPRQTTLDSAAAGTASSAESAPPVPVTRTVEVTIAPPDSTAFVDGQKVVVAGGALQITGALGSIHRVKLLSGDAVIEDDVVITDSGPRPAALDARARKPAKPVSGASGKASAVPAYSGAAAAHTAAPAASPSPTIDTDFEDAHQAKRPEPR